MNKKTKDWVVGIWLTAVITFAIATLVPKDYWMIIWTSPIIIYVICDIITEIIKNRKDSHMFAKEKLK